MSSSNEVVIVPDEGAQSGRPPEFIENGVVIPFERIAPETLRNLVATFVTREWEELGDSRYTLDDKIAQVHQQLQNGKAKVVYDLSTETCNIVAVDTIKR